MEMTKDELLSERRDLEEQRKKTKLQLGTKKAAVKAYEFHIDVLDKELMKVNDALLGIEELERAEYGQTFYVVSIHMHGYAFVCFREEVFSEMTNDCYKNGNYWLIEEEAEKAASKINDMLKSEVKAQRGEQSCT